MIQTIHLDALQPDEQKMVRAYQTFRNLNRATATKPVGLIEMLTDRAIAVREYDTIALSALKKLETDSGMGVFVAAAPVGRSGYIVRLVRQRGFNEDTLAQVDEDFVIVDVREGSNG